MSYCICPHILKDECPFGEERGGCYHAKLHKDTGDLCADSGFSGDPSDLKSCGSCLAYKKLSKADKLKLMVLEL